MYLSLRQCLLIAQPGASPCPVQAVNQELSLYTGRTRGRTYSEGRISAPRGCLSGGRHLGSSEYDRAVGKCRKRRVLTRYDGWTRVLCLNRQRAPPPSDDLLQCGTGQFFVRPRVLPQLHKWPVRKYLNQVCWVVLTVIGLVHFQPRRALGMQGSMGLRSTCWCSANPFHQQNNSNPSTFPIPAIPSQRDFDLPRPNAAFSTGFSNKI